MTYWITTWRHQLQDKQFRQSLFLSFALLLLSFFINFHAGTYATESASNYVTDIILSNIRVYQVDDIFTYGSIIFWIFVGLLTLVKPARIPFILKQIAVFVLVRSVFISLTHLGPFPTQIFIDPNNIVSKFTFGADMFFSGHTGLPFLMALIFWYDLRLRILFIGTAIMFGTVVLMGHLHYSIDVLAAFFITYAIYDIACQLFPKDKKLFHAP